VISILSLRADQAGLNLVAQIDDEIPDDLWGDDLRLKQILTNLLANALKFTEKGEVALRVAREEPTSPGATRLRFTVHDTGIGIPPEKLRLIFEPFAQADASTTRKFGGTGLGLTISSRLAELMGGRIWAES